MYCNVPTCFLELARGVRSSPSNRPQQQVDSWWVHPPCAPPPPPLCTPPVHQHKGIPSGKRHHARHPARSCLMPQPPQPPHRLATLHRLPADKNPKPFTPQWMCIHHPLHNSQGEEKERKKQQQKKRKRRRRHRRKNNIYTVPVIIIIKRIPHYYRIDITTEIP